MSSLRKMLILTQNGLSSTRVDNTAKTRRPQPRSNTKKDRVPYVSKSSCIKNKEIEVEEHNRNLLLSKNQKHKSSECNNIKLAIWNDNLNLWSPTRRTFGFSGKLIESSDSECQPDSSKGDNCWPEIVEVCVDNDDTDDDDDCDMPVCDESSPIFTIFSNPLFDSNENFSSDDESLFEEEIQKDEFNSFSNPLYDIDDEIITNESNLLSKKDLDEIILIPPGIDEPCFNAESDLLESLLNRDSPIDSTKTDSIFDEFSFPRLPEEHNSENVDTIIESLSYSPIPVEDSDSLIEEIDLFLTSDDSMPPGIESDDYDSEGDFRFLEELLINDSLPLPENESYNLDSVNNPESPVVKSCFDFEPVVAVTNDFDVLNDDESFDSGEGENVDSLNVEKEDSFIFLPFVTYPEVLPTSYSTGSEDKVFKPGICDNVLPRKSSLTLDVFDPLHPPLMDFHVTKAFFNEL
ncbi:hypothetical protein Tco_1556047 [Tanacetum coccineum]